MNLTIHKSGKQIQTEVALPSSKSISNRVLIIRHLCRDSFVIDNLSASDDTRLLETHLLNIKSKKDTSITLDCENAGTVFRFLTSLCSISPGEFLLTGAKRMYSRPVQPMVSSLQKLGASISYQETENYPPLHIEGKKLHSEKIEIDASLSSQFVSALLLIAPELPDGIELHTKNESSVPYINMTIALLHQFGIQVSKEKNVYTVKHGLYKANDITIESDWSAASYWYEMAALSEKAEIFLKGLTSSSIQGDCVIATHMKHFGVETEYHSDGVLLIKRNSISTQIPEIRLLDSPDLAPALITCAGALYANATFSGTQNLRHKESDRIHSLQQELKKCGIFLNDSHPLHLTLDFKSPVKNETVAFDSHNDHRIAMALAPISIFQKKITIKDAECVSKSYPGYWSDLEKAGFSIDY